MDLMLFISQFRTMCDAHKNCADCPLHNIIKDVDSYCGLLAVMEITEKWCMERKKGVEE